MWDSFVELLRATIFSVAHIAGGSLGGGIFLVSAGVRLALLPLTLRMARRTRDQQARLAALRPALEAIQRRYANDPAQLWRESQALHAKHGIKLVSPLGLVSAAVQIPLLSGLFAAVRGGLGAKVRFLWIADLARRDGLLLLGVAALSAWGLRSTPAAPNQAGMPAALGLALVAGTVAFLWTASSAVALSMGANSAVSALQNWLIARDARRQAASSA
jgi:YidC/Oxa1 family membrane protein insertase